MNGGWTKALLAASLPLLLGAVATIAWQNSHTLAVLNNEYTDIRGELQHQRELVEQRLADCRQPMRQ